jgi:hypothetical protein
MKNKAGLKIMGVVMLAVLLCLLFLRRQPNQIGNSNQRNDSVVMLEMKTNKLDTTESLAVRQSISSSETPVEILKEAQARTERMKRDSDKEVAMWQGAILYFGKVVDESNQPISGVQVSYSASAMDEFRQEIQNTGTVSTDVRGIFKIDGVKGVGAIFQLTHPNYYPYPENPTGFDKRSLPKDGIVEDSEAHARIFRMHSKGNPVSLISRSGGFHAPNNGAIANYPFRGNTRAEILGQLQIQSWNGLRSDTNPYDWKVQLTMPEGGIVESTNYFDFVAPETGYSQGLEFQVGGSEMARKQYFLKVPSGYIRFKLEVIMGKDMFVSGDYYFNPDGSRNLEPSQEIRPAQ